MGALRECFLHTLTERHPTSLAHKPLAVIGAFTNTQQQWEHSHTLSSRRSTHRDARDAIATQTWKDIRQNAKHPTSLTPVGEIVEFFQFSPFLFFTASHFSEGFFFFTILTTTFHFYPLFRTVSSSFPIFFRIKSLSPLIMTDKGQLITARCHPMIN